MLPPPSITETQRPHAPHPPPILYPRARVVGLTTNGRSVQSLQSYVHREALVLEALLRSTRGSVNDYVEALRRGRHWSAGSPGSYGATVLHSSALLCQVSRPVMLDSAPTLDLRCPIWRVPGSEGPI